MKRCEVCQLEYTRGEFCAKCGRRLVEKKVEQVLTPTKEIAPITTTTIIKTKTHPLIIIGLIISLLLNAGLGAFLFSFKQETEEEIDSIKDRMVTETQYDALRARAIANSRNIFYLAFSQDLKFSVVSDYFIVEKISFVKGADQEYYWIDIAVQPDKESIYKGERKFTFNDATLEKELTKLMKKMMESYTDLQEYYPNTDSTGDISDKKIVISIKNYTIAHYEHGRIQLIK